jgi:hypothetical protein
MSPLVPDSECMSTPFVRRACLYLGSCLVRNATTSFVGRCWRTSLETMRSAGGRSSVMMLPTAKAMFGLPYYAVFCFTSEATMSKPR